MAVRIITDSSADLTPEEIRALGIEVVPMTVRFGDRAYLDGVDLSKAEFYRLLTEGRDDPATAQPSPEDYLTRFRAVKEAGDQAVVLTISGKLSGTLQSALIARELCGYGDIHIVDSLSASAGVHLLAEQACALRNQGVPAEEIVRALEELRSRVRIFALVDTLEYLHRGGRLSNLQAGIGTVTKLKPVISVREGAVLVVGKAFGTAAAMKQLLKFLSQHPVDDSFPAYALYSDDESRVDDFIPRLGELELLPREVRRCSIGPTIGAHIGPGAVGMAYIETAP